MLKSNSRAYLEGTGSTDGTLDAHPYINKDLTSQQMQMPPKTDRVVSASNTVIQKLPVNKQSFSMRGGPQRIIQTTTNKTGGHSQSQAQLGKLKGLLLRQSA